MPERSNGTVWRTVALIRRLVGSNPTPSAANKKSEGIAANQLSRNCLRTFKEQLQFRDPVIFDKRIIAMISKTGSQKSSRSVYTSRRFSGLGLRWDSKLGAMREFAQRARRAPREPAQQKFPSGNLLLRNPTPSAILRF